MDMEVKVGKCIVNADGEIVELNRNSICKKERMVNIMCMYCERRQDVKFGLKQPCFCDENWEHPSDSIQDTVSSNLNINGNPDWEARIYDYQTSTPELILTSKNIANALWGNGVASIYIPIHFCPVCGRKLGKQEEKYDENGFSDYWEEN